ncbi:MAG TPA: translation initiation factor [Hanamia sp.]|nr:translation initiation factor [Hanamia sp.]
MSKKKLYNGNGIVYSTAPDFSLSTDPEPKNILPPGQQLLKIKLDTKHRGGKTVSVVSGFQMEEKEAETLAKQLKSFCGSGGSVKENEIIIQGDHRDKILQWLLKNGYAKSKKN